MFAPFAPNGDSKLAYDGALISHVLKVITPYAVRINELLPEKIQVNKDSLVKVCLLHQIAKSIMFIKNDNSWEVTNKGVWYKYVPSTLALKTGMRSLIMCQECGIEFTAEEIEALTILERENDEQAKYYCGTMSVIVKQANELALLQIKNSKEE